MLQILSRFAYFVGSGHETQFLFLLRKTLHPQPKKEKKKVSLEATVKEEAT